MNAATQFEAIAKLLREAVKSTDTGLVSLDIVQHILRVTEAQVEAAKLGLLDPETTA